MHAVGFGFCFLLQAFQPRFLRLVTVDFDSGWSYGWIILAHVWRVPRGVYISINSGGLKMWYVRRPQCMLPSTPKSSKSSCVHITHDKFPRCRSQILNHSCWCWSQPCNLFSQINRRITYRCIKKLSILQLVKPHQVLISSALAKLMNRDILTPIWYFCSSSLLAEIFVSHPLSFFPGTQVAFARMVGM